jgi:hypothetical protein
MSRTAVTLVIAILLAVGFARLRDSRQPPGDPRLAALLDHAEQLREDADACQTRLVTEEARFRDFDVQVDSMRLAVRALESGGAGSPRTVPAAEYDEYLALFNRYNAAVQLWHVQADSLQASWEACHELSRSHNDVMEEAAAIRYGTGGGAR